MTVVVMTRDRWSDLRRTLGRHQAPVILVDNGSSDRTPELVRQHFPHIEVVELGVNRGAMARNVGVARARTPYVAFADDDSWWAPGALQRASDLLDDHPGIGVVAGRVLLGERGEPDPVTVAQRTSPLGREPGLPGPSVLGFPACGAIVRREAFLGAGGFDPVVFFMGEEERLALDLEALGWKQVYVDDVVAHHHPSGSSRNARGRLVLVARNRLLTALMRRPWRVVATTTVTTLVRPAGLLGTLHALPRVPRALLHRRPVPERVEARVRLLEA